MTPEERAAFLEILTAHERTVEVCRACAETTRDLAAEVKRGSVPAREHLARDDHGSRERAERFAGSQRGDRASQGFGRPRALRGRGTRRMHTISPARLKPGITLDDLPSTSGRREHAGRRTGRSAAAR